MQTYEKFYRTLEEAKNCKALTSGNISTFLSIDENNNIITIYKVTYKQLF